MKALPLLAAALLAGTQAQALSCVRPDPVRSFLSAQEAPESYVVLHGRLGFDTGAMPDLDGATLGGDGMPPSPVPARFEGFGLDLAGFTRPVAAEVTLRPTCAGSWCGSLRPGTHLLFARVAGGGYEVEVGACGGWAFPDPDPAALDALAACMRGERCEPS